MRRDRCPEEMPSRPAKRQEVLRLTVDGVTVDRDNSISITLTIPTQDFVPIDQQASSMQVRL